MAGIYIHIPFCKTKCHYCDFYKSTDFASRPDFLSALKIEIQSRTNELSDEKIESIYFGGGTPSVLKVSEISAILDQIFNNYPVAEDVEITMECNPDDLSAAFLSELRKSPVNRLSIGTQSFNDQDLKSMNRRHNGNQAITAVKLAQESGFSNISIDLIYGLPNQMLEQWKLNVEQAIQLNVSHISAYHLTYHEGTVFYDYLKTGKIKELPDELSFDQFKLLKAALENAGFEHYEISNFAKSGLYSRHNRAYWQRKSYLGFGPSAHSFDLKTRRWNVSSLRKYLQAFELNTPYWENEILTEQDKYNDYVITSLRTIWGISDQYLEDHFQGRFHDHFKQEAKKFIASHHLAFDDGSYKLNREGLFISDKIMEQLLYVED
ncbi:radical SAM family heme chaperone HemW [Mangrovibacterium diazotrophicum]|uniref:Heme chaperone HemW n=1 Tax=Mangrovibacterium diazotrophicum TaxID=1261403 RepID=A0A419WA06_9BACT|nr:radical SAM family heme chaperone HemW [Mangrovibacterium diazotrophicum]RKD92283.1 oxygen-independent coproporphyrinogen-3 oxidase [Mangrovibacterium diazotrophicum]